MDLFYNIISLNNYILPFSFSSYSYIYLYYLELFYLNRKSRRMNINTMIYYDWCISGHNVNDDKNIQLLI